MGVVFAEQLEANVVPFPGYKLCRRVGQGGFGQVWEARTPSGRPVALKFLPCQSERNTLQELRSLQALRQLSHPHLVPIEQVWSHLGYIVLSMELADGNLLDLLELYQDEYGCGVPREHLCPLLGQAAMALDYLNTHQHKIGNRRGIIQHCDVKPSNLLLFGERVKVADFGLTSLVGAEMEHHRRAGTLDYCAPEVFQGRLSAKSDQYALAVSYCLLRSGRLPFTDTPRQFRSDYNRPAPDLSMLTKAEQPIVGLALSREPTLRWPTCGELINRLSRLTG
jgi:serine/threonine protein kinase